MAQPARWNFRETLSYCCACFCPEFALLLSMGLNGGWHGPLLHWRADVSMACRLGRVVRREATDGAMA
jgi:hypothetical protein